MEGLKQELENNINEYEKIIEQKDNREKIEQVLSTSIEIIKEIRNGAAKEKNYIKYNELVCTLVKFFNKFVECNTNLNIEENAIESKFKIISLQAISNLITASSVARDKLIEIIMEDKQLFLSNIALLINTEIITLKNKYVMISIILIFNLLSNTQIDCELITGTYNGRQWLLKLLISFPSLDEDRMNMTEQLIKVLIDKQLFYKVLNSCDFNNGYVDEFHYEIIDLICKEKYALPIGEYLNTGIDVFKKLVEETDALLSTYKQNLLNFIDEKVDLKLKVTYKQLFMWMELFALCFNNDEKEFQSQFGSQLLAILLHLLKALDLNIERIFIMKYKGELPVDYRSFKSIKTKCIELINNCIYENTHNQNLVRQLDALPLILNQCNLDDNNPYIREYSIFAMRNLTFNNLENSKWLHSLKAQDSAPHPVLNEIGYVNSLSEDGKPTLKKVNPDV